MDWLMLLEQYGIPLVVATAFWFFIQKQNKFIQDELQKELRESFGRVEMIIVKLIDQQKKMQLEQKGMKTKNISTKRLILLLWVLDKLVVFLLFQMTKI